jgi:hypothetical protein
MFVCLFLFPFGNLLHPSLKVTILSPNPNILFCASYPQITLKHIRDNSNVVIFTITAVYAFGVLMYIPIHFAISQAPDISKYGVKITYPSDSDMVSAGELTIFGTAKYEAANNTCTVYADWNDSQPMQKATPAGLNFTESGRSSNDFSTWTFTYTSKYHLINEGVNDLTAKLSCDIGPFNVTKFDSVSVNGIPSED